VTVSGQLEKIAEGESESSNISSSFTRAFPAPDNVDAAKADIATAPGKIVVKFPKIRH
jgi:HSP20 family molecular chaperone IbpA